MRKGVQRVPKMRPGPSKKQFYVIELFWGAVREAEMVPKGGPLAPKGCQLRPKGARLVPNVAQWLPKGDPLAPKADIIGAWNR